MQKIYNNDDFTYVFDFQKICPEVEVTLHHFSLFSVCFHFLTYLRSCDKVVNYCFYCSRVRSHIYGDLIHFYDVVVSTQDKVYKDNCMCTQDKVCDFDVFIERAIYMNCPNPPFNQRTCDYYNELRHAQDLFVPCKNVYQLRYIFLSFNLHYVMKILCMMQFICTHLS